MSHFHRLCSTPDFTLPSRSFDVYHGGMNLPVVSVFGALFTVFYIALAWNVIRYRRGQRISIGSGGKEEVARAIRAHGNFSEYVPLGLILLLALEVQSANSYGLVGLGATLLLGRTLHARGLTKVKDRLLPFRFSGMVLTFGSLLGMSLWLVLRQVL